MNSELGKENGVFKDIFYFFTDRFHESVMLLILISALFIYSSSGIIEAALKTDKIYVLYIILSFILVIFILSMVITYVNNKGKIKYSTITNERDVCNKNIKNYKITSNDDIRYINKKLQKIKDESSECFSVHDLNDIEKRINLLQKNIEEIKVKEVIAPNKDQIQLLSSNFADKAMKEEEKMNR